MERVTARMLSVLEETGSSITALPAAYARSFSTESSTSGELRRSVCVGGGGGGGIQQQILYKCWLYFEGVQQVKATEL